MLLVRWSKDFIRKHALRIASAGDNISVVADTHAGSSQDMDGDTHGFTKPRSLARQSAVAPEADDRTGDLSLKSGRAVPDGRLLMSKHLGKIAHQVYHHRHVPLR